MDLMNEKLSGNMDELNKASLEAKMNGFAYLRINSDGVFMHVDANDILLEHKIIGAFKKANQEDEQL